MIILYFPGVSATTTANEPIYIYGVNQGFQTSKVWSQPVVFNNSGLELGVCLPSSSASSTVIDGSSLVLTVYASDSEGSFTSGNTIGFNAFSMSFFI